MKFNTSLIHSVSHRKEGYGATAMPIYQNNSFFQDTSEQLEEVFDNKTFGYAYTLLSNPTVSELEQRVTYLEKGIAAVACASGRAAISLALMNILEAGDEIVASGSLFGGTIGLFAELEPFGIKTHFVENMVREEIEAKITEKTRVIFSEVIGNPRLDVVDLEAVSQVAGKHKIPFIVDATTVTPYLCQPKLHGVDIIIHSASKYISGSGNAISGIIVDAGTFDWKEFPNKGIRNFKQFGKMAYTVKLRKGISQKVGATLAPMNAYMNVLGLETLGVRMERLCQNAYKVAEALEASGLFEQVHYPGLKSSPYYDTAVKLFGTEYAGAIFTFRAGSKERAYKILNHLKYAHIATNIGDVRTLVIHPDSTIYGHNTEEEKRMCGVYDDLVRVSTGLEDAQDIIEDFKKAAEKADSE